MLKIEKSKNLLQQLQDNHLKIVIVDDDSSALMLLHRHLTKLGISEKHIISFDSPEDLLNFVKENLNQVAVIISDLEMSGMMSGFELFIELQKESYSGKFIIYSGADEKTIEKEKMSFPSNSFATVSIVQKTISDRHDKHQIQQILEHSVCVES